MREIGPVRFALGNTPEAVAAAQGYIPLSRTLLGVLKNFMHLGGLQQGARTFTLPDGTVVRCQSVFGQDFVSIATAPQSEVAPALEAVTEEQVSADVAQPVSRALVFGTDVNDITTLLTWDTNAGVNTLVFEGGHGDLDARAISPDGRVMLAMDTDGADYFLLIRRGGEWFSTNIGQNGYGYGITNDGLYAVGSDVAFYDNPGPEPVYLLIIPESGVVLAYQTQADRDAHPGVDLFQNNPYLNRGLGGLAFSYDLDHVTGDDEVTLTGGISTPEYNDVGIGTYPQWLGPSIPSGTVVQVVLLIYAESVAVRWGPSGAHVLGPGSASSVSGDGGVIAMAEYGVSATVLVNGAAAYQYTDGSEIRAVSNNGRFAAGMGAPVTLGGFGAAFILNVESGERQTFGLGQPYAVSDAGVAVGHHSGAGMSWTFGGDAQEVSGLTFARFISADGHCIVGTYPGAQSAVVVDGAPPVIVGQFSGGVSNVLKE